MKQNHLYQFSHQFPKIVEKDIRLFLDGNHNKTGVLS